ncbi:LacI family DNA-binding transcriptional regulator [Limnochorda pilosa]|uniref:LacI family transcription regulator n=1 Tax=Limnochorda pilosa TaxID=1555112 RepID=A0A0K2SFL1_LIMPI|nr:LacI family DNA-binding transcriptional regulator [Limnochorda pilosa]BAS25886.1 LacI family transcription regulator [Limnochorda pilosa]
MASLRQVATLAGVSPATVSRVLNGHPHVSPDMRRRVEETMQRVGYVAARPRGNRSTSRVVALLVPNVSSPFYCAVLMGVEQEAFARGYDLVLYTTEGRSQQNVAERVLQANQVAGLVVITPRHGEEDALTRTEGGPPMVVVDHRSAGSRYPHVGVDNLRGAHRAVQYLLSKGYESIGLITGPASIQSAVDRIRGARLALQEAGRELSPELVWEGDFTQPTGYRLVAERLISGEKLPRALFCANDLMAMGAVTALHEHGLSVPGDVAVMGFDDLPLAATAVPPLTTVRQPIAEMGAIAFRMVVRLAAGEQLETERVLLDTQLVERGSA